ncbi:MAG: sugar phosphate isomerase/epimerase family protein [Chloroflexota bacterium]|nr:sugar phosphate isomerase/epimerase family protein [Chloroflexota bacterium]
MFILSGFADEISDKLQEQLDTLQKLDINYLELRGVWGKNVLDLTDGEVQQIKQELDRRGMAISAIGSPIGKINIDDPFAPHLERFGRAVELAEFFGCRYIRMFSFFVPEGEADAHREAVMDRLKALLDAVKGRSVVLLHENERYIYGDIPRRCRDIFETCASPQLRMAFDPANFVMCGVHPFSEGYHLLKEYVAYLHIKDGLMEEKRVVPAGEGDGQMRQLLRALQEDGYDGFASLEPHLAMAGRYDGFSGPELFEVAARAFRGLLKELDD